MKKIKFIQLVVVILTLISMQISAQEQENSIGFGVSLGKEIFAEEGLILTVFDFPSFYIPVIISTGFRIEPEIGLYRYSVSDDFWKQSYSIFAMGCGFFSMTHKEKVDIYYGMRIKLRRISSSYEFQYSWYGYQESEKDKSSKTDVYIGPAVGGEYFFSRNLSIGGEIQLNYVFLGHWDDNNSSASEIKTNTLIFLRWYL